MIRKIANNRKLINDVD